MARFDNFGRKVCIISQLPYDSYHRAVYNSMSKFKKDIKDRTENHKYLIAITANAYQKQTGEFLEKDGFKEIVTFRNAHNNPRETLTLWVKTKKAKIDLTKPKVKTNITYPTGNCSVGFGSAGRKRLQITLKKDIKGFKQIEDTPIWIRTDKPIKLRITKPKEPKGLKDFLKNLNIIK